MLGDLGTENLGEDIEQHEILVQIAHFVIDVHVIAVGPHHPTGRFHYPRLHAPWLGTGLQLPAQFILERHLETVVPRGIYVRHVLGDDLMPQDRGVEESAEKFGSSG